MATFQDFCALCNTLNDDVSAELTSTTSADAAKFFKAICAVFMLITSAVFGIILRRKFPSMTMEGINAACGGMFIALALFHVLPEAAEECPSWSYFAILGYLAVLFVDQIMVGHHGEDPFRARLHIGRQNEREESMEMNADVDIGESTDQQAIARLDSEPEDVNGDAERGREYGRPHRRRTSLHHYGSPSSFALAIALSFHSVFEGLAIGSSPASTMLLLAGVICAHKWAAAFAITSMVVDDNELIRGNKLIVFLIFVAASPIGCILGLVASMSPAVGGAATSVAGGTLLFVGMTEVIPEEFRAFGNKKKKFLSVVLGASGIIFLTLAFSEDSIQPELTTETGEPANWRSSFGMLCAQVECK